jgi:hypothetical protein
MFQVFHLDVAYVVMAIQSCFKRMFQVFRYFRRILQVLHLDVAYIAVSIHAHFKRIF